MRCTACQHDCTDGVLYCTHCGVRLTEEPPLLEGIGYHGRIQLFPAFVRIVHARKRTGNIVVDRAWDVITQVRLGQSGWSYYLQILQQGERPTSTNIFAIVRHGGSLVCGQDRASFVAIHRALQARCPQAVCSSCLDQPALVPTAVVPAQAAPTPILAHGMTGRIWLDDGIVSIALTAIRGVRTIPLPQITAVEYAPPTVWKPGVLTIVPGSKGLVGYGENTLAFSKKQMPAVVALKEAIETRLRQLPHGTSAPTASASSAADEIAKLAVLRDQGVLTDDEFTMKKRQLLGL